MNPISNNTVVDHNLCELITAISSDPLQPTYPIGKLDAHERDVQHKAVSIFVIQDQKLLIQRRANTKYHSGGLWANTVCTHPRWQESTTECANRRLQEELGWSIPLTKFGEITYHAQVGELFENEHVHCFYGQFDQDLNIENFNRDEVSQVQWLSIDEITTQIEESPESFTEWFKIYIAQHREMILRIMM